MSGTYEGLTSAQADDAKRFVAFSEEWSQDAADADPDEWAWAEQLAEWFREHDYDISASVLVRVLRSCELYDAINDVPPDPSPESDRPRPTVA